MAQNRQENTRNPQGRTDQSGQFKCPECGETFRTENELREHAKSCPQAVRIP